MQQLFHSNYNSSSTLSSEMITSTFNGSLEAFNDAKYIILIGRIYNSVNIYICSIRRQGRDAFMCVRRMVERKRCLYVCEKNGGKEEMPLCVSEEWWKGRDAFMCVRRMVERKRCLYV